MVNPIAAAGTGFFSGLSDQMDQNKVEEDAWNTHANSAFKENYSHYQSMLKDYNEKKSQIDATAALISGGDPSDVAARNVASTMLNAKLKYEEHVGAAQSMYKSHKAALALARQQAVNTPHGQNTPSNDTPMGEEVPTDEEMPEMNQPDQPVQEDSGGPNIVQNALGVRSPEQRLHTLHKNLSQMYGLPLSEIIKISSGKGVPEEAQANMAGVDVAGALNDESLQKQSSKDEAKSAIPQPFGDTTLQGEDYLASLPPETAARIKAWNTGHENWPGIFAQRDPYIKRAISSLYHYAGAEGVDFTRAPVRLATAKSFVAGSSTGPSATADSANMFMQHASQLLDNINKLPNQDMPLSNVPINWWKQNVAGMENVTNYDDVAYALATEKARLLANRAPNDAEVKDYKALFNHNGSFKQLTGQLQQDMHLAGARVEALQYHQERGMNPDKNLPLISPKSKDAMDRVNKIGSKSEETKKGMDAPLPHFSGPDDEGFKSLPAGKQFINDDGKVMVKH